MILHVNNQITNLLSASNTPDIVAMVLIAVVHQAAVEAHVECVVSVEPVGSGRPIGRALDLEWNIWEHFAQIIF